VSAATDIHGSLSSVLVRTAAFQIRRTSCSSKKLLQRVIDLDAKVLDGVPELRMPAQQLNCAQTLRAFIDQQRFGFGYRVCPIGQRIKASINPFENWYKFADERQKWVALALGGLLAYA